MDKKYSLIIPLDIHGLKPESKNFSLREGFLDSIDEETLGFLNEEQFFQRNKSLMFNKIEEEFAEKRVFPPVDISLRQEDIYLFDGTTKKRVLFQNINFKGSSIPLKDIVINKMQKGMLSIWYQLDKERASVDKDFSSFFTAMPDFLLENLELECPTKSDMEFLWTSLIETKTYSSLIRFLLLDSNKLSLEAIKERFYKTIKSKSNPITREGNPNKEARLSIRLPYRED